MKFNKLYCLASIALTAILMAGCGGGSSAKGYDYSNLQGTYQVTVDDATQGPLQISAYLIDRDTNVLTIRDTRDNVTQLSGSLYETTGVISFSDGSQCLDKGADVSCTIKGVVFSLSSQSASATPISALGGNYQVASGGQVYQLVVAADGKVTGTSPCTVSGQLTQVLQGKVNQLQLKDCDGKSWAGVVEQRQIDAATTALEVYLPGASVNGFWLSK